MHSQLKFLGKSKEVVSPAETDVFVMDLGRGPRDPVVLRQQCRARKYRVQEGIAAGAQEVARPPAVLALFSQVAHQHAQPRQYLDLCLIHRSPRRAFVPA